MRAARARDPLRQRRPALPARFRDHLPRSSGRVAGTVGTAPWRGARARPASRIAGRGAPPRSKPPFGQGRTEGGSSDGGGPRSRPPGFLRKPGSHHHESRLAMVGWERRESHAARTVLTCVAALRLCRSRPRSNAAVPPPVRARHASEAGLGTAGVEERPPMPQWQNPCHAGRELSNIG